MAQPKPERTTLDQVLKLAEQLSSDEQEQLVEHMKLQWLRTEVQKGIDEADRGELLDSAEVFAELKQRYRSNQDDRK